MPEAHPTLRYAMIVATATLLAAQSMHAQKPAREHGVLSETITVVSGALHQHRLVNIHLPVAYDPASRRQFPVLYMPDGGMTEDFPHIVKTVDSLIAVGAIRPVIVVGIPNTERRRDLTGPTTVATDSAIAPRVGGSGPFRRFLLRELVPAIDARYRTTNERSIIGESLAGLFIVETFVRDPDAFTHYLAFDPSLWWDGGALVDSAATAFRERVVDHTHVVALYLAASRDDIDGDTGKLAEVLRASSRAGLHLTYVARKDLTHASIFHALAPSALAAALR